MSFNEDQLRGALATNDSVGLEHMQPGARTTGQHGDFVSPAGVGIGAALGLDKDEVNKMAEVFAQHIGAGKVTVLQVFKNEQTCALAIGMVMGWLARVREEADNPEEVILNQVVGYLKGKATAKRDEIPNAVGNHSELNKQATALELAAEALEAD